MTLPAAEVLPCLTFLLSIFPHLPCIAITPLPVYGLLTLEHTLPDSFCRGGAFHSASRCAECWGLDWWLWILAGLRKGKRKQEKK